MKKIMLPVILLTILAIGIFLSQRLLKSKSIHIHAGFQVYNDGRRVDFSNFKYMHEKPCTVDGKPVAGAKTDEQVEKAHLHDQKGDIVHVHRENATWGDLFKNIKYTLPKERPIIAYVNGGRVDDILNYPIKSYDSIFILLGKSENPGVYLDKIIKKDEIIKVEKKSETCSS